MAYIFELHNDRSENNFDYSIQSHYLRREKYYLLSEKYSNRKVWKTEIKATVEVHRKESTLK